MRKILTLLLLVAGFAASSQQYNNEWIKYTQTYYKIRIAKDGLYRLPKSLLDANGLGGAQVQNLELWRNGEKVPFYPSVSSGVLPANGYIEFWGKRNDGKPDKPLYRDPAYQHTTYYSLQSDTATYFLSVNTSGAGFKYTDVNNNVAGNSLPAEPYFMYTYGNYYANGSSTGKPNLGLAWNVGSDVYSSSYDMGEFFASGNITPAATVNAAVPNLSVYNSGGPAASMKFGAVGNAANNRNIVVRLNGTIVKDAVMNYYDDLVTTVPVDNNALSSGSVTVSFTNTSANSLDRMQVSFFEINYPRTFDFAGASNFEFELPARPAGYFLRIGNFNYGGALPVLYDTKNGERYTGSLNGGIVEFALTGSATNRQLVLVSEDGSNINTVTKLTARNFIDYGNAVNQGTYIIVSNPILYVGSSGNNPVQDYKNYRESTAGGGFKVLIADINDLVDQFAFGINKHPLSVRNFIRYARAKFAKKPEYVFLIGKGVTYYEYQYGDRRPNLQPLNDQLNLVPTFGYPGSDNLLSAEDLTIPVANTPIGRLSVVYGKEIEDYLDKLKEYELNQKNAGNTIADRGWMKNVVHITGSTDAYLGTVLCNYMDIYRHIIEDTLYGGNVQMFCKGSTSPGNQVSPEKLAQYFKEGLSIVNYFGHSSATTLEFNIDDPYNYNNPGKYPVFFVNGCKAGDFFTYSALRLQTTETLSEKFTLAKQRGGIAFVASTHYGIVNYLNLYLSYLYQSLGAADYDKSLGLTLRDAFQQLLNGTGTYDFYARMHAEQMTLDGDPAVLLNAQLKPDYVIEDQTVEIAPPFISVAEGHFTVKVKTLNLGKALADSVVLEVKQQYPNGSTAVLYRQKIRGVRYADSVELEVPIISTRDKGLNKIIATIDADGNVNEISESNNTITKQFFIFENEARPVYPYTYAIVNNPNQTLFASTANPLDSLRNYVVDIDTTASFNSSLKVSKNINASGGVFEINPGITYLDSTVYYWRIAAVPKPGDQFQWLVSSFMYINGGTDGFAQNHYFQNLNSNAERVSLDTVSRQWKFGTRSSYLSISTGTWGVSALQEQQVQIDVDGDAVAHNFCAFSSITFNVFDPVTFKPWTNNYDPVTGAGQYGSWSICPYPGRETNFEYQYMDTASRAKMRNFMENVIPDGYYVVARTALLPGQTTGYAAEWANDTTYYGQYKSIYHSLLKFGLTGIDSFSTPRQFIFVFKKNDNATFSPVFSFTKGMEAGKLSVDCITPDTIGFITSPVFGPARGWKEVIWKGVSMENPSRDNPSVQVVGIKNDFTEDVLYTLDKDTRNFDISAIDTRFYPNIKLRMRNIDSTQLTPFQLQSWKVTYDPVPEGSMAANMFLVNMKDTLTLGETAKFGIAFKNISKTPFDSIKVKAVITDRNNVAHTLFVRRQKPIVSGDTIIVQFEFNAMDYPGNNLLLVDVNTENDQREQYFFNNFAYKNFYVVPDDKAPLLDVTFDGVHILNKDIVSAKPHIQIKLTDESNYLLLNDTTLSNVQVRYPDGTLRTYSFDGDTLRFIPATSGSNNTATIEFTPQFTQQINPEGDVYELIVKGKDRSGNKAGEIAYRVGFTVISKPMISNVLNYPNPFSTSTAFVFTITGSEVPQNVRIQILTVTGKIVREITMNELGPLHIGRNITEFKWNGTDQYGDKLANGVYLYRVVTSMNGKTMEKYKSKDDNTDKYFNNGYGKMYLMR